MNYSIWIFTHLPLSYLVVLRTSCFKVLKGTETPSLVKVQRTQNFPLFPFSRRVLCHFWYDAIALERLSQWEKNKDQTRHQFIDTHKKTRNLQTLSRVFKKIQDNPQKFWRLPGRYKIFFMQYVRKHTFLGRTPFFAYVSFSVHNIQSFRLQRNHSTLQWKQWLVSAGASSGDSALANMYGSLKIYV